MKRRLYGSNCRICGKFLMSNAGPQDIGRPGVHICSDCGKGIEASAGVKA